jgi:hypothetical protein
MRTTRAGHLCHSSSLAAASLASTCPHLIISAPPPVVVVVAVGWEQYVQHHAAMWACNVRITVPLAGVQACPAWCRYNKCRRTSIIVVIFVFVFVIFIPTHLPPPSHCTHGIKVWMRAQYIIEFHPPLPVSAASYSSPRGGTGMSRLVPL